MVSFSFILLWRLWLVFKAPSAHVTCFWSLLTKSRQVSSERPIFIRERLSKTYSTSAYFWANAVAELPLLIAQPVILVAPSYFVIQLHTSAASYFLLRERWLSLSVLLTTFIISCYYDLLYHCRLRLWATSINVCTFDGTRDDDSSYPYNSNDAVRWIFRQSGEYPLLFLWVRVLVASEICFPSGFAGKSL